MTEASPKPTSKEVQDPGQRALERFEKQITSPRYNTDALQQALNGVERVGTKIWSSPGEMYVALAQISERLAENAREHGIEKDVTKFTDRQQQFELAGEQIARKPEGPTALSSPSRPRRTTGQASG